MKRSLVVLATLLAACGPTAEDPAVAPEAEATHGDHGPTTGLPMEYLDRYLETFPTRALGAGHHEYDHLLEDLGPAHRAEWIDFNRSIVTAGRQTLAGGLPEADRLDVELVVRQAELELIRWIDLATPETNPLFWTGIASNATVFLLVRDDLPLEQRLQAAATRASLLPRLVDQAIDALADPTAVSPDLARMASGQAASLAGFYRDGFARVGADSTDITRDRLVSGGREAAAALDRLAAALNALADQATGSPRVGAATYASLFATYTDLGATPSEVEADAVAHLAEKRAEAAEFGRSVWTELMGDVEPPDNDQELVRALFRRVEENIAESVDDFVEDYRTLSDQSIAFVRELDVVTIPEPLDIWIGTSPDYFVGQSVGGVYPAGPFAPEAPTLLFLPTPPSDATDEQQATLFRAFNHHFNTMITPHELVPGHTLQLVSAAQHPRKVRAMFADDVYVEGWGTFCERLMLDLGWGGPADRIAHLKKQMENIARTIVDIRVHTTDASADEITRFVRDEALQDEQFAANMWRRAITSSPQLTTYYLGYQQVMGLYREVERERGEAFVVKTFMDGMMELGPVPVAEYRDRMLGSG